MVSKQRMRAILDNDFDGECVMYREEILYGKIYQMDVFSGNEDRGKFCIMCG